MIDKARTLHWGRQIDAVMLEIGREATICKIRLLDPGVIEAVMQNNESICGSNNPRAFTKSGLMVGLGETREEIMQVMDDLRAAEVDFLTIGQYLQPTRKHAKLERFWTPEEFASLEAIARAKGFLMVSASPLTRSSYHADSDFAELKAARAAKA